MEKSEDSDLIKKILSGDRLAFRNLIEKYEGFAFNLALKFTNNSREIAEEITQDAFVKAYNHLPDFRLESKFSTWLYKIIFTTSMNERRKNKNLVLTEDFDTKYNSLTSWNDFSFDSYDQKLLKNTLSQAIGQLPDIEQIIVTLYYLNEQTLQEISEIIGMERNQIKSKLFRARIKLKALLDSEVIRNTQ
jgi:RNA polymerase sigma-70 factor (ECF subfamily)